MLTRFLIASLPSILLRFPLRSRRQSIFFGMRMSCAIVLLACCMSRAMFRLLISWVIDTFTKALRPAVHMSFLDRLLTVFSVVDSLADSESA
jgi:hypothetical protein